MLYPRGARSGGPEALHQLVDAARAAGVEASLVPAPGTEHLGRVPQYDHYDAPESSGVADEPGSAVVAPEILTRHLLRFAHAELYCWWLSIDNSVVFRNERRRLRGELDLTLSRPVRSGQRFLSSHSSAALWKGSGMNRVRHLTQSQYAWSFLHSRFGILPSALGDYLDPCLVGRPPQYEGTPVIAFNPRKGGHLVAETQQLMAREAVDWLPLVGLTSTELQDALARAWVYLDLGHQPGKDRMPREAALLGAVTIVQRQGAGAYHVDTPLPCGHRLLAGPDLPHRAADLVRDVLADPGGAFAAQTGFRDAIARERSVFQAQTHRIFVEGRHGLDHGAPDGGGDGEYA